MSLVADPVRVASGPRRRHRRGGRVLGWAVLLVAALYFLVPVAASVEFSLRGKGDTHDLSTWSALFEQPGFAENMPTSLELAVGTVLITLLLMVPTTAWVHLRLPRLRRLVESICVLPLVIPAVVLANGVLVAFKGFPNWITGTPVILALEYVVLALPFTFRTLDSGLAAIPLTTLVEAARNLGASWPHVLLRVVVPNLRTAILNAAILSAAMVLGEFTIANLLLLNTLPVWTVQAGQQDAQVATAASMLILLVSWALLMLMSVFGQRGARRTRRSR
ncbi:ABC transporter permease subunit [Kutzneria viridogrisea]|uniref:Spermidine/putrescine transport system permease protein n=1 Tax=Kutzneria viridogrisea TaxID=47990 RepID=A0ABR6BMD0_9PSEU|nr:putative spermidine/putrescine transport system permease protein [Kutzneria viridogrisea]